MDVSIIIVSWNVRRHLRQCLQSLYQTDQGVRFEVIVVDNNSSDGSAAMVTQKFPRVHCIRNKTNRGFAAACNQGIRRSRGSAIVLLNPDTEVKADAIGSLYGFLQTKDQTGICGGKILNFDGTVQPSVRRFPDLCSQLMIALKLHRIFSNNTCLRSYVAHDFDYDKAQKVDQVMGAFFMISRDLINAIGLLDEHYYIWFEEVDYCRRACNAGYQIYYYPEAVIQHHRGASFRKLNPLTKQFIYIRSMQYYFFKHKSVFAYIILLAAYPFSILAGVIVAILTINTAKTISAK